jgi:hypothetical protein
VLRASPAQVGLISACQPGAYMIAGIAAVIAADRVAHRGTGS